MFGKTLPGPNYLWLLRPVGRVPGDTHVGVRLCWPRWACLVGRLTSPPTEARELIRLKGIELYLSTPIHLGPSTPGLRRVLP